MPRDPRIAMWAIGLALAAGAAPAASLIPAAPTRAASTAVPLSAPIPDAQRAQVAIRNFAFQPAEGVFDSGALNQGIPSPSRSGSRGPMNTSAASTPPCAAASW
jgi:hypothetical protein